MAYMFERMAAKQARQLKEAADILEIHGLLVEAIAARKLSEDLMTHPGKVTHV